jgi:hypothetical protein
VNRFKCVALVVLCLVLASCGSDSQYSEKIENYQSSNQTTYDDIQYYGFAVCLSQVNVLHSPFSNDPSQYEYKFACLNATGSSTSEVVRSLSAQATESLCPRSFSYTERAGLGGAINIKLKAQTPTGPSTVFSSKKAYDDQLAMTPCSGGKQSYTKKVGQGAHPTWMTLEVIP